MPIKFPTFTHKFGGWHEAEAHRWRNPDGSEGGIVAVSASVHESVVLLATVEVWPDAKIAKGVASIGYGASIGDGASIGPGASIGHRASIGDRASIGPGASIEADDWFFVIGPQGSRNAWATAVWSARHGLRWWVGCQRGISTEELRERVERDHGPAAHGDDYRHAIATVETHPGLARAIAAHATKRAGGTSP